MSAEERCFLLALSFVVDDAHPPGDLVFWNAVEAQMFRLGASPEVAHAWAHELHGEEDDE